MGRRTPQSAYERKRAAEKRAKCESCGVSDAACTRKVFTKGRACCSTCGYTDTHPKPDGSTNSEPCVRCHGTGIEPHPDE
jgi:hypothetical protein